MEKSDLELMLRERGNPCLSIVIPTVRYTRGRMQNPTLVEKSLMLAKKLLATSAWPTDKINQVQLKLDAILSKIDYLRLEEGLAIFISPNVARLYLLPFPVKEKVMLSKKFEVRDIFYLSQFLKPYFLLTISKKRLRLFKGMARELQEITNTDFPKIYEEEYEYAHPSIGSGSSGGLKSFERDKSIMEETRMTSFFRVGDTILHKYLKDETPLFIAGVKEELISFERITHHVRNVAGHISGNYDIDAVHPLAEFAWKKIKDGVKVRQKDLLTRLREDVGKQLAVDGIGEVWRAAKQGKGSTLLVERDYQVRAYHDAVDDSRIFLQPPVQPHEMILDAADDLIEIVKEKGGEVVIVENGELNDFKHIALLLRYHA